MGSIPGLGADVERLSQIDGAMPRLTDIPRGCAFHPRCPRAFDKCRMARPDPLPTDDSRVACWLYEAATEDG